MLAKASAPCAEFTSSVLCDREAGCHYCRYKPSPLAEGGCFETSSMFACPRRPACTRVTDEYRGHEYGPLEWISIGVFIAVLLAIAAVVRRPMQRKTSARTAPAAAAVTAPSSFTTTSAQTLEEPLLADAAHAAPAVRQWKLRACGRALAGLIVVVALFIMAYAPSPPLFSVCDVRWNVLEAEKSVVDFVNVELTVSIWNPNRFDLDLDGAQGHLLLHAGGLADFDWKPTRGEAKIRSGHVLDTRVVVKVQATALREMVDFFAQWVSGQNIILTLNLGAYFSLHMLFGLHTPRMSLGSDLQLNLTQVDRLLCTCNDPSY